MVLCQVLLWRIRYSASVPLFIYCFLNRPFIKLKECSSSSGGRPNISRSSSSTSSFSSTTGEAEALEELETVSATLTVQRRKCINITQSGRLHCAELVFSVCFKWREQNWNQSYSSVRLLVVSMLLGMRKSVITENCPIECVKC